MCPLYGLHRFAPAQLWAGCWTHIDQDPAQNAIGPEPRSSFEAPGACRTLATVGVVRIEPEPTVKASRCPECAGTNHLLHGYVYDDDVPHGIYFAEWCDGTHPERQAFVTLGIGTFGDDTEPAHRRAFCVAWHAVGMQFCDQPARDRLDLFGTFVPRERALQQPDVDHVWHVIDHVVLDDPRLVELRAWIASD
jgi:hypothetical protein